MITFFSLLERRKVFRYVRDCVMYESRHVHCFFFVLHNDPSSYLNPLIARGTDFGPDEALDSVSNAFVHCNCREREREMNDHSRR